MTRPVEKTENGARVYHETRMKEIKAVAPSAFDAIESFVVRKDIEFRRPQPPATYLGTVAFTAPPVFFWEGGSKMTPLLANWRAWVPIVSGFGLSALCPMRDAGSDYDGSTLPQRPPALVFPIVWAILFCLLGYSWTNARHDIQSDAMHGVCVLLLSAWTLMYACLKSKRAGLYTLAGIVAVTVCCMCLHEDKTSKIALTPMLAWLLIALQLNWHVMRP